MNPNPLIETLAEGFRKAGAGESFNYPGFHANELHEAMGGGPTSINERTAYSMAWGYSLGGKRALVSFKNVGLNDAADPFLASIQLGCHGGLVLVLFEDMDIQHSQNRMDSRYYFNFFGGLWLEPGSLREAAEIAAMSFDVSEELSTPVVIRITNILYQHPGPKVRCDQKMHKPSREIACARDPFRWVAHPMNAAGQETARLERQTRIQHWVESYCLHQECIPDRPDKIIFGAARGVSRKNALRLTTLPLPAGALIPRRTSLCRLPVYEHGTGFVTQEIRRMFAPPIRSCGMQNRRIRYKYHCREDSEALFHALRQPADRFLSGDLGEYTMDPHRTLDACLCYGSSVAVAAGVKMARPGMSVTAITGDGAYAHAGSTAFEEAVYRNLGLRVYVFDNGGLKGTGGQAVAGGIRRSEGFPNIIRLSFQDCVEHAKRLSAEPPGGPELYIVKHP